MLGYTAAVADDPVARLANVDVLAQDGTTLRLGTLWAERAVVLVMIRHFG
jgi:hypothetical protein